MALKGKNGKVVVGAVTAALLNTFSLSWTNDTEEATPWGNDFKEYETTLSGVTADVSGILDIDCTASVALMAAAEAGSLVTDLSLYISATGYYSGDAHITGMSIGVGVGSLVTASFTIQFSGDVTRT